MFGVDQIVRGWNRMAGAFQGLRVLDLSWGIAGPMTTMFLADNGAEVIRIEPPLGDPFAQQTGYLVGTGASAPSASTCGSEEGRRQFDGLARTADVVVQLLVGNHGEAGNFSLTRARARSTPPSSPVRSPCTESTAFTAIAPAMTGWSLLGPACCSTRRAKRDGHGVHRGPSRPPLRIRRSRKDWSGAPIEQFSFSLCTLWPSIGATYFATLGIAAALRACQVSGLGQRVATSLLQGALAAACLNWQRVENPDAPLYWMWPVDSRSIEGLYECADGKWVHHWTLRPQWVLAAAEGQKLSPRELEGGYLNDPDRAVDGARGRNAVKDLPAPSVGGSFQEVPRPMNGSVPRKRLDWVSPPSDHRARRWLTSRSLPMAAWSRSTTRRRNEFADVGPLLEFSATPWSLQSRAGTPSRTGHRGRSRWNRLEPRRPSSVTEGTHLGHSPILWRESASLSDLGLGVAGPFTGRALADLGADVIKVNALHDTYWNGTHMGLGTNRGKRSIALNLKKPDGREVLEKLLQQSDVITLKLAAGSRGRAPAWDSTTRRFESATRHWSTAIPGATRRVQGRICPALTRMRRDHRDRMGGRSLRRRKSSALESIQHGRYRQRSAGCHRHLDRPLPSGQDRRRSGREHFDC